jgi:MFS family permease
MTPEIKSRYFRLRIDRSNFATLLISITIYFSWLFAFPLFGPIINSYFDGVQALALEKGKWVMLFLASMVTSNLITGYLVDKSLKRLLFIFLSTIFTSILTFAFIWVNLNDVYLVSILLGLAAGVSPVAIGAYFADNTQPEERGRIMGISVGLMMPIAQLFLISESFNILTSITNVLIIVGILILITFLILTLRPKERKMEITSSKGRKRPNRKQIILYAIPIFLFYLISGILLSIVFPTIQSQISNEIFYLIWALPFLIGAIYAGINLDLRGRKFPTIIGLAITGISLAILAFQITLGYLIIIPLAIGYSFLVVTSFIIWADLAPPQSRGTFYGIGFGIIAAAQLLGLIATGTIFGSVSSSQINVYMIFSSVALFLSIPPLILADEALPRSLIEKRKLLEYLDGVKDKFVGKK